MANEAVEQLASLIDSNLDLTEMTADEFLELMSELAGKFIPEWEPNTLDPLMIPIVIQASHHAMMAAYYLRMEKERDFFGAEIPAHVLSHCRSRGYTWAQTTPATVYLDLVFDVDEVGTGKVIAAGSMFSTEYESDTKSDIEFMRTTNYAVSTGQSSATIECSQVSQAEDSFTSTALRNQEFTLTTSGYVEGSAQLSVSGDTSWTEVSSFANSGSLDKHYRMLPNSDMDVVIRFGDGTNGVIPTKGALIELEYYASLGSSGRVAANTVTSVPSTYTWITSCTNPAASDGGRDQESMSSAKANAVIGLEAKPSDGGTGTNYTYNASTWLTENVGSNKVRVANHPSQNVGIRIVVLLGDDNNLAEAPSSYVIAQLQAYFDESLDNHNATDRVYVEAGSRALQQYNLSVVVYDSEDLVEMRTAIIDFLIEHYSIDSVSYGGDEPNQPNWSVIKSLSEEYAGQIYNATFTSPEAVTEVAADSLPYIIPPEKIQNDGEDTYVYGDDTSDFTVTVTYKEA